MLSSPLLLPPSPSHMLPSALPHILLLLLLTADPYHVAAPVRAAPSLPSSSALSAAAARGGTSTATPAYLQPCTHFSQCNPGLFCYTLSPRTGLLNVCAANNNHIHGPDHKQPTARCFCHNRFRSCAASSDCHPHEACATIRQRHPGPRPEQYRQNGMPSARAHTPPAPPPPQQQNGKITVARSITAFCTPCKALDRGVQGVRATAIDTAHNCASRPPYGTSLANGPSPFLSPWPSSSPVSSPSPSPPPSVSAHTHASPSHNAPMLYTFDRCRSTAHNRLFGSAKRCAPGRQCIDIVQTLKQREAVPCMATYFSVECSNNIQSDSNPSKRDCQNLQPSPQPSSGCVCAPDGLRFRSCARASDCPVDERCADVAAGLTSAQDLRHSVCVSCTQDLSTNAVKFLALDSGAALEEQCPQQFLESDDETQGSVEDLGERICIAVHHLGDLRDGKELVFPRHRRAAVLCDAHGNCATAAHVVVVNGRTATMREYCAAERFAEVRMGRGCSKRVMWVNSPRMRRGVRVRSRHEAVQFTAFAANGGTAVERWAIQLLVVLGM